MNMRSFPAWHNGRFCKVHDVKVSVQDLGLMRSDGIYEVLAIRNGRSLALSQHIQRFLDGCKHYYIRHSCSQQSLHKIIAHLYTMLGHDCQVSLVATRGIPDSFRMHSILKAQSQIMIITAPHTSVNDGNAIRLGIARTVRRIPDVCIDQRYKNFARQDFTIASIEIAIKGYEYPLLLDQQGLVTESSQFSVAIIKDNKILTPARNRLPSITLSVIKELANSNGIEFDYCDIDESMLLSADDMFAATTAGGIISITQVDNKVFSESVLQKQIKDLYSWAWTNNKFSTVI